MLENIILYWLLPSLVTVLLIIHVNRKLDGIVPGKYDASEVIALIVLSFIYPLGLMAFFCFVVWPWLIKERKLTKN
jgi:hypothetical protein